VKTAALVGVKDEVELIGASISHLRRIGVQSIVVSDYGSTDGTLDVLEAESSAGDLKVIHVDPASVPDYDLWSAHQISLARETGADWVMFLDADEFLIPVSGSLPGCRHLDEADVLMVDRFNVLLGSGVLLPPDLTAAGHHNLWLFTRRVPNLRAYVETHPEVPFISLYAGPKVMARPCAIRSLAPGSHDAVAAGPDVRLVVPTDLLIAHIPFSTASRFARKVENMRAELERNAECYVGDLAWHWKRWVEMTEPGAVEQEFARQFLDAAMLDALRREGVLRTAAALFDEPQAPRCAY
jgi:hypothetical protein